MNEGLLGLAQTNEGLLGLAEMNEGLWGLAETNEGLNGLAETKDCRVWRQRRAVGSDENERRAKWSGGN